LAVRECNYLEADWRLLLACGRRRAGAVADCSNP
jgi:hypothetical protein